MESSSDSLALGGSLPGGGVGACGGFEGDAIGGLVEVFAGFAALSAVAGEAGGELANAAGYVLDELIELVGLREYAGLASGVVEWVPVDLAGVVGCLGVDGLAEAVEWAARVLSGAEVEGGGVPGSVEALGECGGWSVGADALPPTTAAAAVLVTLVAAVNRSIASSRLAWAL